MGLGIGSIVSVGGTSGGSSGGSGIQELNGQIGPIVTLVGTSGIIIDVVAPNQINIGFSGIVNANQSGVVGVNGIVVHQVGGNFVVDGVALSGQSGGGSSLSCFEQDFSATTSGFFQHNLGTRNVVVQIADNSSPPRVILPDEIILDTLNALSVLFNAPQTGSITVLTCANGTSVSGVQKFSQSLTDVVAANVVHGLGSEDVIVQVIDSSKDVMLPDRIRIVDSNTVFLQFNDSFSGRVTIVG